MTPQGFRLGVDFGTSNTVAMLTQADEATRPVLFDGYETLPSAVYADGSGGLLVGRDALHAARSAPAGLEPNPKRRIDESSVLLGDVEVTVVDLIAAVLRRVDDEARRVAGTAVESLALTHPAGWGPRRREILIEAARAAGLGTPTLVAEPVAAASYLVDVEGSQVPAGSCVVVYDFGAGTFDASVLRRTGTGFEVLSAEGLPDAGGLDIDAAIMAYLGATYSARDAEVWQRLTQPATAADQRAAQQLWQDVRAGKEMLSRATSTTVHIPLIDDDAPLGREQFEQLARPLLDRTVAGTRAALREAGVDIDAGTAAVAEVFLVGGSSRIPLAATLLHRALRIAPTVVEQPERVVAQGSLHTRLPVASPPARARTVAFPSMPAVGHLSGPATPGLPPAPAVSSPPAGHPPLATVRRRWLPDEGRAPRLLRVVERTGDTLRLGGEEMMAAGRTLVVGRAGDVTIGTDPLDSHVSRGAVHITAHDGGWQVTPHNPNGVVAYPWAQPPHEISGPETLLWSRVGLLVRGGTDTEHWVLLEDDAVQAELVSHGSPVAAAPAQLLTGAQRDALREMFAELLEWPPRRDGAAAQRERAADRLVRATPAVTDQLSQAFGTAARFGGLGEVLLTDPGYLYLLAGNGCLEPAKADIHPQLLTA